MTATPDRHVAPGAPVGVLGAGSWGTALALLLARNGHPVRLWARDAVHLADIRRSRRNQRYLPGFDLPANLQPEPDLAQAAAGSVAMVLAVPTAGATAVLERLRDCGHREGGIVCTAKGFVDDGTLLDERVAAVLGERSPFAVLSGPTFAAEIAAGYPAAVTVASRDHQFGQDVSALFRSDRLRVYPSDDVRGVELGGAVKNVLAIAAGIADGLGFGANTRAALITRGLSELMRFGEALGGRAETFMGLSGLGDLVLTCTDDKSRNRRFGLALARGMTAEQAALEVGQVVEGARAARLVMEQACARSVDMPISEQVLAVVEGRRSPREALASLLQRSPREGEFE